MGSLKNSTYTIPLPDGASIKGDVVTWTAKGQKKTGKLSGSGRVLCKSGFWIAKYVDENDKVREVSTKSKSKEAAQKVLSRLENEVTRIRAGVMTPELTAKLYIDVEPIDMMQAVEKLPSF